MEKRNKFLTGLLVMYIVFENMNWKKFHLLCFIGLRFFLVSDGIKYYFIIIFFILEERILR